MTEDTFSIDSHLIYHPDSMYVGFVQIAGYRIYMHWYQRLKILYGSEERHANSTEMKVFTTRQILALLRKAKPDDRIWILSTVLPYWEKYKPKEVAGIDFPYLTQYTPPEPKRRGFSTKKPKAS